MASEDHGDDASRGAESHHCGWGSFIIGVLLFWSFLVALVTLAPMVSIPGLQPGYCPDDEPTTCSVELVAATGLEPALALGATSPTFSLVVHVANGHVYGVEHGGGDVVVSYAGVPLARGRTPGFRLWAKETWRWAVNVTGAGLGLPADLARLMAAERRWGVAQLEIDMGLAWQSFTCDVLVDGHPSPSACRLAWFSI